MGISYFRGTPTRSDTLPVIALPLWTEVVEDGVYRLVADCENCRQRRGIFEFDTTSSARRVCFACQDGAG